MIEKSAAFLEMTALVAKTADRDAPVPPEGETGTGQERVARDPLPGKPARPTVRAGCNKWLRAVF
jgi:transcriptional regulator with GAF, ATPase, and Fis domain